jgi:hypothetical protein
MRKDLVYYPYTCPSHEPLNKRIAHLIAVTHSEYEYYKAKKQNEDILELSTKMNIKNPLIEWYIHRSHRLVQRERGASIIQTTKLVHHILVES